MEVLALEESVFLNAFIRWCEHTGIDPKVMRAAWDKNLEVRKNHDWKEISGATSE